jgi:hypothetical protein
LLAIATNDAAKKRASGYGPAFVLERPLVALRVARVLRAVYGLMVQDRRRYFRLAIELAVSIRTSSGAELKCKTINISSEGMALHTPSPLQSGETVGVVFAIPNPGPLMIAEATVIWDDKHGKSGLQFHFANSQDKDRISEWLDSEFYMQPNVAQQPFTEGS